MYHLAYSSNNANYCELRVYILFKQISKEMIQILYARNQI